MKKIVLTAALALLTLTVGAVRADDANEAIQFMVINQYCEILPPQTVELMTREIILMNADNAVNDVGEAKALAKALQTDKKAAICNFYKDALLEWKLYWTTEHV